MSAISGLFSDGDYNSISIDFVVLLPNQGGDKECQEGNWTKEPQKESDGTHWLVGECSFVGQLMIDKIFL